MTAEPTTIPPHEPVALTVVDTSHVTTGLHALMTEVRHALNGNAEWVAIKRNFDLWGSHNANAFVFERPDGAILKWRPEQNEKQEDWWLYQLLRKDLSVRSFFGGPTIGDVPKVALIVFLPEGIIVLRHPKLSPASISDCFLPAPDLTGHDMLDLQQILDLALPGRFRIS